MADEKLRMFEIQNLTHPGGAGGGWMNLPGSDPYVVTAEEATQIIDDLMTNSKWTWNLMPRGIDEMIRAACRHDVGDDWRSRLWSRINVTAEGGAPIAISIREVTQETAAGASPAERVRGLVPGLRWPGGGMAQSVVHSITTSERNESPFSQVAVRALDGTVLVIGVDSHDEALALCDNLLDQMGWHAEHQANKETP